MTPLALRFAARELRSGVRGFGIFLASLALGVAAIAAAGSTAGAGEDLPFGVTFIAPGNADAALARFGAHWQHALDLPLGVVTSINGSVFDCTESSRIGESAGLILR